MASETVFVGEEASVDDAIGNQGDIHNLLTSAITVHM